MVDASEDFHEVSEIMSRHATLLATNRDLQRQQQRVTDLAEETRYRVSITLFKDQDWEALYGLLSIHAPALLPGIAWLTTTSEGAGCRDMKRLCVGMPLPLPTCSAQTQHDVKRGVLQLHCTGGKALYRPCIPCSSSALGLRPS